jgi:urocanate hydratase
MNGGVCLCVEVDPIRIQRRVETGYCDEQSDNLDAALERLSGAMARKEALSIGLLGNIAEVLPELVRRGIVPDIVTDQTSAHDLELGYIPIGYTTETAEVFRLSDPKGYQNAVLDAMQAHIGAMLDLKAAGAITFDYGNNLRGQVADHRGMKQAFDIPGFVPEFIRPLFCKGSGPFRWAALSGDPQDIAVTDQAVLETFPQKEALARWIHKAQNQVHFQGIPARICWLEYGERAEMGLKFNWLVKHGKVVARWPLRTGKQKG